MHLSALVQVQLLHVDAALGPVTVIFSGAREPIAAAGATAVFGRVAVARQVTAPPALYTRQLPVGRVRAVEISVRITSCVTIGVHKRVISIVGMLKTVCAGPTGPHC